MVLSGLENVQVEIARGSFRGIKFLVNVCRLLFFPLMFCFIFNILFFFFLSKEDGSVLRRSTLEDGLW